jgi:hypothetical protein
MADPYVELPIEDTKSPIEEYIGNNDNIDNIIEDIIEVRQQSCVDVVSEIIESGTLRPLRTPRLETQSSKGTVSESPPELQGTLISRQWYFVLPISLILYTFIQVVISNEQTYACNVDKPFAAWTQFAAVATISCYSLAVIYNLLNGLSVKCWAYKELSHLRGVYASAATICLIGGAATGLPMFVAGITFRDHSLLINVMKLLPMSQIVELRNFRIVLYSRFH